MFSQFLVLFFIALAVWSWATPLYGVPDEPAHEVKAVAVVRGQFSGSNVGGSSDPYLGVTIPQLYARAGTTTRCFAFKADVPASCAPTPTGGSTPTKVSTYVGRYPPLYYSLVGLPSLATASAAGVYLMRLASALLSAVFLALAATTIVIWSRSVLLLAGLALAATPTLFFLGGAINPSGLEVSSAICLWCAALVLVLERSKDPPPGLVATVAFSGTTMVLIRGLSPLWLALIGLSVLALAPRRALALLGHRSCRFAAAVIAGGVVLALVWIVEEHTLDFKHSVLTAPKHISDLGILEGVFGRTPAFLAEMIGQFGWLDTPSPLTTYVIWYVGVGALVGVAVVFAGRRQIAGLLGVTLAGFAVPFMISASEVRNSGFGWQGKDSLPLVVGIPLVAAAAIGRPEAMRGRCSRLVGFVAVAVAVAQVAAFAQALRRNAVGLNGPLNYLHGSWRPPLGAFWPTFAVIMVWSTLAASLPRAAHRMEITQSGSGGPVQEPQPAFHRSCR